MMAKSIIIIPEITKIFEPDQLFDTPDILGYIQDKTELTRTTILNILKDSGRLTDVLINPQLFLDNVIGIMKSILYELMVDGIKYEKIGDTEFEMRLFDEHEVETYIDKLTFDVENNRKTIYDKYMPLDSEVEMQFAKDCESREDIEFYFKLPNWFVIKTPIGTYNPDWALVFKNEKKVYFVAETKSTTDLTKLRPEERMKIKCDSRHFKQFENVDFKHITVVEELR